MIRRLTGVTADRKAPEVVVRPARAASTAAERGQGALWRRASVGVHGVELVRAARVLVLVGA